MDLVNDMARQTGDFYSLSENDKQLIGLAIELAAGKGLQAKREVQSLEEFKPHFVKKMEQAMGIADEQEEEQEVDEFEAEFAPKVDAKRADDWAVATKPEKRGGRRDYLFEKAI